MSAADSLEAQLASVIAEGRFDEAAFEAWALRVFHHQFERNRPYREYCIRQGRTPPAVERWDDVPPVPAVAFRHADFACGEPEAVFRTSGTTAGVEERGRHLVPHLALYRASALAGFARYVLPDEARLACVALLPPPELRPDSSLVRMCAWVGEALATGIEWLVDARGLDVDRVVERLGRAEAAGESLCLLGPTAGFVRVLDACREARRTVGLGPGTRIMDTGGTKGMSRPVSRAAFLRECWTVLGVAGYHCVNEYGMTELSSQRWDSVLYDRFHGRSLEPRRLLAPPWLRTRVLDPDTLDPVAPGTVGLLCHHDLANAGSVSVVLTEDLGRTVGDDGIEVMGRVTGSTPRGCAALLEAFE